MKTEICDTLKDVFNTHRFILGSTVSMFFVYSLMSKSTYKLLSIVLLVFWALFTILSVAAYFSQKPKQSEEHLIIGYEAFPWSNIEGIALKRSEYGNIYLAIYFRDGTPPNGFDTELLSNREELIYLLRNRALEKGFTFEVEEGIVLEEPPSLSKASEKGSQEQRREKRKDQIQEKEKTEEKKIEIKISPRKKFLIIISLAVIFFLGICLIFGIEMALVLFLIVLVHELGHFAALKGFRMKVHGIFFIPFFGAGVIPKDDFPSPEVEAVVALAGPVAGLSWNLALHVFGVPSVFIDIVSYRGFLSFDGSFSADVLFYLLLSYAVLFNLLLNLLNLAPLLPLDGGRIVRAALLRGRKSLIPVTAITIGTGIAAAVFFKSIFIGIVTLFGLGTLIHSYKQMEKKEIEPPVWWKSAAILGAWIGVILLYWFTLPLSWKTSLLAFFENI